MPPDVSIIIPTRDRAAVLPRAIESVLCQSFSGWELIVVDDGSSDDTASRLLPYLEDCRIRYCGIAPSGVSAARNMGISLARAEWLAFLDSDDVWMPEKLAQQMVRLRQSGDRICHADEIWIRAGRRVNSGRRHRKPEGWIFRECLPLCVVSPSSAVVHRSVLEDVGRFDESYPVCEDYELWLRIAARYRVSLASERLVIKYGGHEDQLSRRFWGMDRWRARALYGRLCDQSFPSEWRQAASDEMKKKLGVVLRGYARRGKENEARQITEFLGAVGPGWDNKRTDPQCGLGPPDFPEIFE